MTVYTYDEERAMAYVRNELLKGEDYRTVWENALAADSDNVLAILIAFGVCCQFGDIDYEVDDTMFCSHCENELKGF